MSVTKRITGRRCDEAMKRSKERCITPYYKPWRCNKKCRECICCLEMGVDGLESHFNPRYKGESIEELKTEGE